MSIKLVSLFKQRTGEELPTSFFHEHPTIADVEAELDADISASMIGSSPTPSSGSIDLTPLPEEVESNAVLIQGRSRSLERPVFLVADGHGSADAFIHLPSLPNGQRPYELESLFVHNPAAFSMTIPELARVFIKTIRSIQPHSPYIIGSRSAGAAYAYEVAYQLTQQGKVLSGLILIDMRVPRAVPHAKYIDRKFVAKAWAVIVEHTNVLLDKGDMAHAAATIKALYSYDPVPMPAHCRPRKVYVM